MVQYILNRKRRSLIKPIARIDQIQQSIKNWAISIWGGSLYLIIQYLNKSGVMILTTAIIPFYSVILMLFGNDKFLK